MSSRTRTWSAVPQKPVKPKVTSDIKSKLTKEANEFINNTLKPKNLKPVEINQYFNHLVDIYSKWYGSSFYFCSKYNCHMENAISPSFEMKFARMTYAGDEKFNLSYMRHNDTWFEIYTELSIQQCIDVIRDEPYFMP